MSGFLIEVNTFGDPTDACRRYFEAQCEIHKDKVDKILSHIGCANDATMERNLKKLIAAIGRDLYYPGINLSSMMTLWRGLGASTLAKFAEVFVEDPYGFRAGWPDLTLAKGTDVRIIEVKTTDKIHSSQRDTIRELLLPAGAKVSVLRVKYKLA